MVLMGVSFTVLDIVYVSVVLNYCVQCSLLLSYVNGLLDKIREHLLELEQVMIVGSTLKWALFIA